MLKKSAKVSYICEKGNFTIDNYKVVDHNHLNG